MVKFHRLWMLLTIGLDCTFANIDSAYDRGGYGFGHGSDGYGRYNGVGYGSVYDIGGYGFAYGNGGYDSYVSYDSGGHSNGGNGNSDRDTDWSYSGPNGPDHWPYLFPTCGGQNQSPIDLPETSPSWRLYFPLAFQNYDSFTMTSVSNNGNTAVLSLPDGLPDDRKPSFTGGGLADRYVFKQLHFHWGSVDSIGSEHTVNGKSYAGEMHLVHYNSKYGDFDSALKHSDGLAVLGVFFQSSILYNGALHPILKHLSQVKHAGDSVVITEPVNFFRLLPCDKREFYRYQGSLTTPPCSEIVTWTVFRNPLLLTSSQLAKFRQLTDNKGKPLVNNFRPVQPLNNREVDVSF